MITEVNRYDLTFTASSLRLNGAILVANAMLNDREIDYVNELGNGKETTGKRMLWEFRKRLSSLTPGQLKIQAKGGLNAQKQVAFLSVCKAYGLIRDFVVEVLREKYLVFDYQITEGDYISFFRRKAELHPELEAITEGSQYKIKQVLFKILEQAGIIDSVKNKMIQPQLLDDKVINAIVADNPDWLKVFLISDMDIENMKS
jgi:hypothetical protein